MAGRLNPPAPVVVAIDAGTGSCRALAFEEGGLVIGRSSREWTHPRTLGHPGGTQFDAAANWQLICDALLELTGQVQGRTIAAVSASSMREGFVLYDAAGAALWACPNTDGRATVQAAALVEEGIADDIYAVGGDWVSITAPARLRWLRAHQPELLDRSRHLGMLSDWVNTGLTGLFATEPTCGSSTAMFDLRRRTWSARLANRIGVAEDILPTVLECGEILGKVSSAAAAQTGLPAGTPVVMGGADTQLALHGIGATPARPTIVAGTFWQTTTLVDEPVVDQHRRLRTLCHVAPREWMIEGIGFLSGLAMRWFRDAMCPDLIPGAAGPAGSDDAFDRMEALAAQAPAGCGGLVAVLSNTMQADSWHHAAPSFVGFDLADPVTGGRGAFVRAIEEAAAFVTRAHLDIIEELVGHAFTEVTFTGGSSAGRLWPQIVADTLDKRLLATVAPEATSLGAARIAAEAVGLHIPDQSARREIKPDPAGVGAYRAARAHWQTVYASQLAATVAAGNTPLFRPPGGLPIRSTDPRRTHHGRP